MKTVLSSSLHQPSPSLRVVPVTGRAALRHFIHLPWSIYADDPAWIPPLLIEQQHHLSPKNPFFQHARWRAWLVYRGDRPVGRISAQIDRLHLQHHHDNTGFFGLLEAENNPSIFQTLLHTAEAWLREQGLGRVLGPFNLSINDEMGLLVDGFDTPPTILMGHGRPYYRSRVEEQGYRCAKKLFAYRLATDFPVPAAMQALTAKTAKTIHIRPLDRVHLKNELIILRDIFNDAWSHNWNFVPFTEAEFMHLGQNLVRLIRNDFIQIAEVDGAPAAMVVLLPDLNKIIADLDGRLLPFGWVKLLWRLKRRFPASARVPLLGVRRQYQETLLGTVLAFKTIDALRAPAREMGIRDVELSWILEDNTKMRHLIEALGGKVCKQYWVYEKMLV